MFRKFKLNRNGRSALDNMLIISAITAMALLLGKGIKDKLPQTIDNAFKSLPSHVLEQAPSNE